MKTTKQIAHLSLEKATKSALDLFLTAGVPCGSDLPRYFNVPREANCKQLSQTQPKYTPAFRFQLRMVWVPKSSDFEP
jgi:hypothetical protein